MFWNSYPYTDFHELNLDWCIKAINILKQEMEDFFAGNKITFADPILHDLTKTYAKNTIVMDVNGNAFISVKSVPVGVQLSDSGYWMMVFDFESYVEKANKNLTDHYFRDIEKSPVSLVIGDWLVLNDVLYRVTANIAVDESFVVGDNIEHFTVEGFLKDFLVVVNQMMIQYKQELENDVQEITDTLSAQLTEAIAGMTVDSEVIDIRVGANGETYATAGDAVRGQYLEVHDSLIKDGTSKSDWLPYGVYIASGGLSAATNRLMRVVDGSTYMITAANPMRVCVFAYKKTSGGTSGGEYVGCYNGTSFTTSKTTFTRVVLPTNDDYFYRITAERNDDSDIVSGDEENVLFYESRCTDNESLTSHISTIDDKWEVGGASYNSGAFNTSTTRAHVRVPDNAKYVIANNLVWFNLFAYKRNGEYVGVYSSGSYIQGNNWLQFVEIPDDDYDFYIILREWDSSADITDDDKSMVLFVGDFFEGVGNLNNLLPGKTSLVDAVNVATNKFAGKKLAAIGDSITYGFIPRNYTGYPGQLKSFAQITATKLNMEFDNQGISGSTVAIVAGRNPMCERYDNLPDDADLICVMGGTNDIRNAVPLGTMEDNDGTTFYGALKILLGGIYKKYFIDQGETVGKTKKVVVCTPIKLLQSSGGTSGGTGTLRDMSLWVEAVKEVAAYYSFPVLDFYNVSGINPHLDQTVHGYDEGYTDYYNPYITDGTHPTQEGAEMMAEVFMAFINTI